MQRINTVVLALLISTVLSGCAGFVKTIQTPIEQATPVPKNRLLSFQEKDSDSMTVVVIRDYGILGSGCFLAVEADGKLVARMDPGEVATFYLSAGEHELTVAPDPNGRGLCVLGFSPVTEKYLIKANDSNKFRLSSRQYRRPELEPLNDRD